MSVWLMTIADALDGAGGSVTLRYSSGEYDGDAYAYEPGIVQPALLSVSVSGLSIVPSARAEGGEMTLNNIDGAYDYLADYAVDGRTATSQYVDDDGVITTVLTGRVRGAPIFDGNIVSIRIRDAREVLEQPHPQATYAGSGGLEGAAGDLQGKPKPIAYGNLSEVTPVLLVLATQIYDAGGPVSAVYDGGVAFTVGADYPDLATLLSTSPSPGHYRRFDRYFRLGSAPTRTVTCDIVSALHLLGDVFAQIALEAGFTTDAADVAAANTAGSVRIMLTDPRPTADLLDLLAVSLGGYWAEQGGVLRLQQLVAPTDSGVAIEDHEGMAISRQSTGASPSGLPFYRIEAQGDRIETVQTDVPASPNAARLASQYRTATWEDLAVKARHPLAEVLKLETALCSIGDCQTLVDRLGPLLCVRRDSVTDEVRFADGREATLSSLLMIGAEYTRVSHRLGYATGRALTVLGFSFDAQRLSATFNSWG